MVTLLPKDQDLRWMDHAVCATLPLDVVDEIFWVEPGKGITEARMVCEACTVQAECLEYALTFADRCPGAPEAGIYGGKAGKERRRMHRERMGAHGTVESYDAGCRCSYCRAAHAGRRKGRRKGDGHANG